MTPRRSLEIVITGDSKGASRAFRGVERDAGTLTGRLRGAGAAAARTFGILGGAYVVGQGVRKITSDTVNFDKSMRNVNSIAQLNEKQYDSLSKSVLKLAGPTAQAPQTLADGLYDLVSSGFDAKDSLKVLNASARAATAGLTTTEVSTKAVAAVLNAYHQPAKKATDASDVLFRTVDRGVISFEELSTTVGDVLPFASSLGVNLRGVGASISTMTKEGISGSESVTRLKNVMTTLLKPGDDLKNVLKNLGYESGEAIIKQEGFQGALEAITKTAGGSKAEIAKLFPNIRSLGGVLALTGENSRNAAEDLKGMEAASGATAKALSQQSKSISFQWNRLKAVASEMSIEFGLKLVPAAKEVISALSDKHLTGSQKMSRIGKVLTEQIQTAAKAIPGIVEAVAPAVAKSAGVLGFAVVKGMAEGFWHTDLLGKLFMGAAAVRIFGGSGALLKVGGAIAAPVGRGLVTVLGELIPAGLSNAVMLTGGVGAELAKDLATSMSTAVPIAFGAIGIGNIVYSAVNGDMKDAGAKAGGALAGGIAGALVGGPAGAAIGVGLGSVLGGVISGLFKDSKQVNKLQDEIKAGAQQMAQGIKAESSAITSMKTSSDAVSDARHKQRKATNGVKRAEEALITARKAYGPATGPVIAAETRLALAKQKSNRASKAAKDAQRQEGVVRRASIDIMRDNVATDKAQIATLKQRRKALLNNIEIERNKANPSLKKQGELIDKLQKNNKQLNSTQVNVSKTIRNAAVQIGPKFARSLEQMTTATAVQMKMLGPLGKGVGRVEQSVRDAAPAWLKYGDSAKTGFGRAGDAFEGFARSSSNKRRVINANMKAMPPVQISATGMMVDDFNQKKSAVSDGGTPRVGRQRGGQMFGGAPTGDSIPALLERGEYVLNRKAVQKVGVRNLNELNFKAAPRLQEGGIIEPRITGGSPSSRGIANTAISGVHRQAVGELKKLRQAASAGGVSGTIKGGIGQIVGAILKKWPGLQVTSTTGGTHAANSLHYQGRAVDLGGSNMDAAAEWIKTTMGRSLTEGIHNPNLSIKYGQGVPASFWGEPTWSNHLNHIHVAKRRGGLIRGFKSGGVVGTMARVLARQGFDHKAAAGIIGNAYGESNWNPAAMEPGTDNGGLFGFTAYEKSLASLRAYAARKGKPWTDVTTQVQFMLMTGGRSLRSRLNALDSIPETTKLFMDEYERPGIPRLDVRTSGAFSASKLMRGMDLGKDGKPAAPKLTKAQKKAKQKLIGGSSKALRYAKQVRPETKRPGLAKKAIVLARKARTLAKDDDMKAARAALLRSGNLADRAAKSIPGLKGYRGPFADKTYDPSKPFALNNLPGFRNLPPSIKGVIGSPGLSLEAKLALGETALDLAGNTKTKADDAAAYNLIIGTNKRKRLRSAAIVRSANSQLRKGGLTRKRRTAIVTRRDDALVAIGEANTSIGSAKTDIRGLNGSDEGGSESDTAAAMKELTAAIREQNKLQSSVQATSRREAISMLADALSGQFVGKTNGFAAANPGVIY